MRVLKICISIITLFALACSECLAAPILLDAGHGAPDGGAVGINGVIEKDCNLAIVKNACMFLKFCGVPVALTRTGDSAIYDQAAKTIRQKKVSDIKNRLKLSERLAPQLFVSVHMNSSTLSSVNGAQIFYAPKNTDSQLAAKTMNAAFAKILMSQKIYNIRRTPVGVYLMDKITCPAILLECGFISNATEEKLMASSSYQWRIAFAITCGILTIKDDINAD